MTNKISKFFLVVTLIAATFTFTSAQNQPKQPDQPPPPKCNHDMKPGQPNSCPKAYFGIPDLTPDQMTKIDDLKLQHMKEVTPLKDQLKEKQARINTLLDAEKSDMGAVNAAIDEFTNITNQLIKKKAEFRLAVRNILTDKQKIIYDSKSDLFADNGCCMDGMGKKGNEKCGPGPGPGAGPDHKCPDHK
jgi:Spy/CpxP family protein refolding chaperone